MARRIVTRKVSEWTRGRRGSHLFHLRACGDGAALLVNSLHAVLAGIGNKQITLAVEDHVLRLAQRITRRSRRDRHDDLLCPHRTGENAKNNQQQGSGNSG